MKILVTGASGFIGRHLCSYLLSKNHSLKILLLPKEKVPDFVAFECYVEFERIIYNADGSKLYVCFLDGSNDRFAFRKDDLEILCI